MKIIIAMHNQHFMSGDSIYPPLDAGKEFVSYQDSNILHKKNVETPRETIVEKHNQFLDSLDAVLKQHSKYVFITSQKLFDRCSSWLFLIPFKLKNVFMQRYLAFHIRFYSRMSKLLFNIWQHNLCKKYPSKSRCFFIDSEKTN